MQKYQKSLKRPTESLNIQLEFSSLPPYTITAAVTDQCGILRAETCSQQTFTEMQIRCMCCPGSQIISQTKTISAFSGMKNVCHQHGAEKKTEECKNKLGWRTDMTGNIWKRVGPVKTRHQTHKLQHSEASERSQAATSGLKPYLTIDLQESLGMTGNTLLICSPWSYSVTSPVVSARPHRKPAGDTTTKESGNRFHISNLFCHYCSATWTY